MSRGDLPFHNFLSGETLIHRERADGKHDLKIVQTGVPEDRGGHIVFDPAGNPVYVRDTDGRVIA